MSTNVRLAVLVVGAAISAALAVPEVSSKLPPGLASLIAVVVSAILHQMNPKDDKALPPADTQAP